METKTSNLESFHDEIENLLTYMALSVPIRGSSRFDRVDLGYFDGAFPSGRAALAALGTEPEPDAEEDGKADEWIRAANPKTAAEPIDFAWITDRNKNPEGHRFRYALTRVRQVSVKTARGRLTRHCESNYVATVAIVDDSGKVTRAASHYVGWAGGRWYGEPHNGVPFNRLIEEDFRRYVQRGITMQAACEDDWRVLIGWEGSPRVMFPTDPVGVREVFRLRDIPNGAQRRAALRHWVAEHTRRTGDEKRTDVRAHLRGATEFTWSGLRCKIVPSKTDRLHNCEASP